jgi:hypothetical protein
MSIYVNTTLFRTDIGSPRATGTRGVFAATGSNKISSRRFAVFKILQSVTDVPVKVEPIMKIYSNTMGWEVL